MKMYLNAEQTAKLIELGFEKPKSISGYYQSGPYEYDAETNTKMAVYDDTQYPIYAYSIGELIEMLPEYIEDKGATIDIGFDMFSWVIAYLNIPQEYVYCTSGLELIDALYGMVVKLKEEGVI